MDPSPPSTTTPAATGTPTTAAPTTAAPAATTDANAGFTKALDAELQRIQKHATKVETLKNGAKLYHLPGGRLVEAAPGKSPYVVAKGDWKTKAATATPPATTAPATTTAPTTTTTAPATTTTPTTTPTGTDTGTTAGK